MKKISTITLLTMIVAVLIAGCSKNDKLSYEGELKFTGIDEEFSILYDDIFKMDSTEAVVKNISSEGEQSENKVEGVLLETLLNERGLTQKDYSSIRFIAGDGYEVDVPAEILKEKDIVLAYKFDDELLDEKLMPLRVAIDDVRSMYYVGNLVEIQFFKDAAADTSPEKVVLLETAYLDIPVDTYTYYDSEDTAIYISDLFDAHLTTEAGKVYMLANDGYEKLEDYSVVYNGYIKTTGEDAPLFTGKDAPTGMNVKYLMNLQAGSTVFASVISASETLTINTIGDKEGVVLSEFVDMTGLLGDYYILTANDGYSVEVSSDSLKNAIIYLLDDGACAVKFDETYPKSTRVKYLLSIELGDGENSVTGENMASEEMPEEEAVTGWTILFEGLSDGSFDMTEDRAQRKLELVELHTERMKDDVVYPEDWKGYRLLDMLEFLHVEDFESVTIIAGDGYEVILDKETIDSETILAVEKNGDALTDEDNLVQLVRNTQFATTWVKGVVQIIID